jgi:hypothetical protein
VTGFELIIQDSESGIIKDISTLVTECRWTTTLDAAQPGKLEFSFVNDELLAFDMGSPVTVKIDGWNLFYGYVANQAYDETNICQFTCYDQLNCLKNAGAEVFKDMTADVIFQTVCGKQQLNGKVVSPANHKCAPRQHDNKSYYTMLQDALNETLIYEGNWYIVSDNFGTLEFIDITKLRTDLVLGDSSLVTGYSYERSIDGEVYNQIKLVKENKETLKRDVYIVKDSENMRKWGLLQYFAVVEEAANAAQIEEQADKLLELYNHPILKFSTKTLGDSRIKAGSGVYIDISELYQVGVPKLSYGLVTKCTHSFKNFIHDMDLGVRVIY